MKTAPAGPQSRVVAPHVQAAQAVQARMQPAAPPAPRVAPHVQAAIQRKPAPSAPPPRVVAPPPAPVRPPAPRVPQPQVQRAIQPKAAGNGVIQCVRVGVWNAQNVRDLDAVRDEIIGQVGQLMVSDRYVTLTVTEVLPRAVGGGAINGLRQALSRAYPSADWYVEAVDVGRTALGARREYQVVISNFEVENERLGLSNGSDYRSASVATWTSTTGTDHSVAAYHAFGPGNPDRATQTTAVRAALRRDHVDVALGDWNQAPTNLAGYTTLTPTGATTAGGNQYDYAVVRDNAPIGAEDLQSGNFLESDHRLISARVGERSARGRLRFTTPSNV